MEEIEIVNIDGINFIVNDEIIIDNIKYVYLNNENNLMDFRINKVQMINDEEYLVKLDSDDEFDKAIQEFVNKHQDALNDYE